MAGFTQYLSDISVRKKLIMMMMLIAFITLLLSFIVSTVYNIYSTRASLEKELSTVASIVGKRIAPTLLFSDQEKARSILGDIEDIPSLVDVCIFDEIGDVFASYHRMGSGECSKNYKQTWERIHIGNHIMQGSGAGDNQLGTIIISANMDEFYHVLTFSLLSNIIVFISALGITFLIATRLHRIITTPLRRLIYSANKVIKEQDYSFRPHKHGNDEIGKLTTEFNIMMDTIVERDNQLRDINSNLEKTVDERTRDLRFTIERLEKANKDKELWVSNMTHELRTPAHHMQSFSKIGLKYIDECIAEEKAPENEKVRKFFDSCLIAARRMHKLVEGVLTLGKLNSGEISLSYKPCNMHAIIETVVNELQLDWESKRIEIAMEDRSNSADLQCDEDKMTQVVTNVLKNAIKFSPEDERISVIISETTARNYDQSFPAISVHVKDHGPGIPDGEEADIFNAFTQSSKTFDGSGGTGLGLSIAKQIVEAHEGKISASNNAAPEAGCCFIFYVAKEPLKERGEAPSS